MSKNCNISEINPFQEDIMRFVNEWVHTEKTPVPHSRIVAKMKESGTEKPTTIKSLKELIRKGYLRKAVNGGSKLFYIQLRW